MRGRFTRLEARAREALAVSAEFDRLLSPEKVWPEADSLADENELLSELTRLEAETTQALSQFRRILPLHLFRIAPAWLLCLATAGICGAVLFFAPDWQANWLSRQHMAIGGGCVIAGLALSSLVSNVLAARSPRPSPLN